jgi:hypothetical protein
MGTGSRVDPQGYTMRVRDPAATVDSARLSGDNPGYSVKEVGVDSLTGGPFGGLLNTQACWSGKFGNRLV